jgi:predicted nuclease with TOPRIM domain
MNLPKEFYTLTKEKQEEEANRITEKYYRMAEKWRKVAILVRTGKISSNPLEEVSRIGLN